jgi:hypothetical protein
MSIYGTNLDDALKYEICCIRDYVDSMSGGKSKNVGDDLICAGGMTPTYLITIQMSKSVATGDIRFY